jgi:DMSO/TMAO reductase YedYZ molybdopterin-dependent catalytic subunit
MDDSEDLKPPFPVEGDSGEEAEPLESVLEVSPEPAPAESETEPTPPAPGRSPARPFFQRFRERPEEPILVPGRRLRNQTRRDFFLFGAGAAAAAAGFWFLLPEGTRGRVLSEKRREWLDSLEARLGGSPQRRENILNRALTFDDDVAEALYSRNRRVRTYRKSDVMPLRNNYDGQTPDPDYIPDWRLFVEGLASGRTETLSIDELSRFPVVEQVTRLCCVEGWSAVAWWGGLRWADFLARFPPHADARWAALDSSVNLDSDGDPDPYYVSIDLATARHPQTLLATHLNGRPLTVEHGAPLRLVAPMKLGLKNIKAVTKITYSRVEPPDYWNQRGYSKYDGL